MINQEVLEVSKRISVLAGEAILEVYNNEENWNLSPRSCRLVFRSMLFSQRKERITWRDWTTLGVSLWTLWTAPKNLSKRTDSLQ